jgi:hypothetical protein
MLPLSISSLALRACVPSGPANRVFSLDGKLSRTRLMPVPKDAVHRAALLRRPCFVKI